MKNILENLPEEASIVELIQLINYVTDRLHGYRVAEDRKADDAREALYDRRRELSDDEWADLEVAIDRTSNNAIIASQARIYLSDARDTLIGWEFEPDSPTPWTSSRRASTTARLSPAASSSPESGPPTGDALSPVGRLKN